MTTQRIVDSFMHLTAGRLVEGWALASASSTDAELLEAARRGEGEAISRLVERYSLALLRYLKRMVVQQDLAEDLLQETWLKVVERLDRHQRGRPFLPWLFAIGRNCAIDFLRRRDRWPRFATPFSDEDGESAEPVDQLASKEPSPLETMSERELQGHVARLIPLLPPRYREALTLRFEQEMALEEMALVMNVPASTAKTRVHRGLNLLRRRLEER
ncbi:MAG: sigma-70 family RNA polymerase sigma factor [Acidobacteria bacterium]|nr:sigma-70 family RNA polymerase sigma factor [Acidobacteriota bacterium]